MAPRESRICPTCGRLRYIKRPADGTLGTAIAAKRAALGLSLRDVAEQLGVDLMQVHRAEQGRMPQLKVALTFARWLGVPLEALFAP